MALNDEMYKQYLRQKQLEEYNKKKKELNSQRQINGLSKIKSFYDNINSNGNKLSNFGQTMSQSQNGAVANLGNKLQSFGNRLQSFGQPSTTAINNPITSSIGSEVGSNALSNSLLSATGGAGASEGTSAISSAIGKAAPSATSLAGTGGAGLSSVAGAAGKAAPFLGAGISGAQAAQDASKGDYIGAGLNGIAAGASFVPGVGTAVAMGAQALDKVNKMFRAAKDKANAKAMQQSMEELQKSEQANDESLAGLQDTFQNDSEQTAQNMTLPTNNQTLSQDMMSQINPNYTSSASGSPTGFAANVNTPDDTQTLQKDQSGVPQIEQSNMQQPTTNSVATKNSIMDRIRSGLTDLKTGYDDNVNTSFTQGDLYNRVANNQQAPTTPSNYELLANDMKDNFTDEQIQAAKQGLNGGNADIAALVDKYSINKPTTEEDIALAREGNFNPQETTGAASPVNSQQTKKSIMQRIGELAGTGQRIMSNPYVQGLVAGTIAGVNKGDIGEGLEYGINWAQNKAKSDNYYRLMNPGSSYTPFLGNYDTNDYKTQQSIELDKQELAEKIRHNIATADEVKRYHDLVNNENIRYHNVQSEEKMRHNKATEGETARYHSGQLGISQQRLALSIKKASTVGQKQKLLDDYKKQVQEGVSAYISASPRERQELKAQLVKEHGVDILKYLNEGVKGTSTNTSTNTNTNTDEPSIYSGLMNRLPKWFYTDYEEED